MIVEIEKMVHGGHGLGRTPDGEVILVRGAMPQEHVRVHAVRRRGALLGEVVEVLRPSPDRIEPDAHPGLDYSFIAYEHQLTLKATVVQDAWSRACRTPGTSVRAPEVVASPRPWGYRNRVQPCVVPAANDDPASIDLGYRLPESRETKPLQEDRTADAALQQTWKTLTQLAAPHPERLRLVTEIALQSGADDRTLVTFVSNADPSDLRSLAGLLLEQGVAGVSHIRSRKAAPNRGMLSHLGGAEWVEQRYGDHLFCVSPTLFAQPNAEAFSGLLHQLQHMVSSRERTTDLDAVDLYAGPGTIALAVAPFFGRVTAVEIDPAHVAAARTHGARAGLSNLRCLRADLDQGLRGLTGSKKFRVAFCDPPRSGLSRPLREQLVASNIDTLFYVSCDVATWCRDAAYFLHAGWNLTHCKAFDLFPQTHHIELLTMLERGSTKTTKLNK